MHADPISNNRKMASLLIVEASPMCTLRVSRLLRPSSYWECSDPFTKSITYDYSAVLT